jgi:uncharacterized protein
MADPAQSAAPPRIDALDILRGVAMCGIIFANVHVFSGWMVLDDAAAVAVDRWGTDHIAHLVERTLLEGKFYSIFSLLFGLGMGVQLRSAERNGADFSALFVRRLWILAAIGLTHATLFWAGDILLLYAMLGAILFRFRNASDRTLQRTIIALLLLPIAWYAAWWGLGLPDLLNAPPPTADAATPAEPFATQVFNGLGRGSALDWLQWNLLWLAGRWVDLVQTARFPKVLGMFLLGLWIERRGILRDPAAHHGLITRTAWIGVGVGLPLNAAFAWLAGDTPLLPGSASGLVAVTASAIGTPLLALGYVAAIILALRSSAGRTLLAPFRPVGRMALSNYLSQSVLLGAVFYSRGLGRIGTMGFTEGLLVAAAVLLLLIPASALWMQRFAYGPVEWAWRQWTYERRVEIRRARQ